MAIIVSITPFMRRVLNILPFWKGDLLHNGNSDKGYSCPIPKDFGRGDQIWNARGKVFRKRLMAVALSSPSLPMFRAKSDSR